MENVFTVRLMEGLQHETDELDLKFGFRVLGKDKILK